jgi:hypothetical protein
MDTADAFGQQNLDFPIQAPHPVAFGQQNLDFPIPALPAAPPTGAIWSTESRFSNSGSSTDHRPGA